MNELNTVLQGHWLSLIQSCGIIGSIWLAAVSLRRQTKQLTAANLFLMTQHHRELWGYYLDSEKLKRVFDRNADAHKSPVTEDERMFVTMMFLHTVACVKAARINAVPALNGLEADLRDVLISRTSSCLEDCAAIL